MKIKGNYISRHHLKRISIIAMHDNIVIFSYPHVVRTRTFAFRLLSLYAASLVFPQTASSVTLLEYLAIVLLLATARPCVLPLSRAPWRRLREGSLNWDSVQSFRPPKPTSRCLDPLNLPLFLVSLGWGWIRVPKKAYFGGFP